MFCKFRQDIIFKKVILRLIKQHVLINVTCEYATINSTKKSNQVKPIYFIHINGIAF